MIQIRHCCYNVNLTPPMALALEADAENWASVCARAEELIRALPGRMGSLYFLGNRKEYKVLVAGDFSRHAHDWLDENKDRASLLAPIEEALGGEAFPGRIFVLASRLPVDAVDLTGAPHRDKYLFAQLGGAPWTDEAAAELDWLDASRGAAPILAALKNPAREIVVAGRGFAPLRWHGGAGCEASAEFAPGEGAFRLLIRPSIEGAVKFHIMALAADDEIPAMRIAREKGGIDVISGAEEPQWFDPPAWTPIPEAIRPILDAMLAGKDFECPQCGARHKSGTFLCPEGDIILKGFPLNVGILVANGHYFPLKDYYAHPLSRALVAGDGRIYVYQNAAWVPVGDPSKLIQKVEDDVWYILHRI